MRGFTYRPEQGTWISGTKSVIGFCTPNKTGGFTFSICIESRTRHSTSTKTTDLDKALEELDSLVTEEVVRLISDERMQASTSKCIKECCLPADKGWPSNTYFNEQGQLCRKIPDYEAKWQAEPQSKIGLINSSALQTLLWDILRTLNVPVLNVPDIPKAGRLLKTSGSRFSLIELD